jgi:hypothetical protein
VSLDDQARPPGRPDEHLGQRQCAGAERLVGGGEQSLDCLLVQRVPLVEMRDQDAGVNHHAETAAAQSVGLPLRVERPHGN